MKNNELLNKLNNLCEALNECDIPAKVTFDGDGEPILLGILWNCNDGSAIRLEVGEDPCNIMNGEILACANPLGCSYWDAIEEDDDEEDEE